MGCELANGSSKFGRYTEGKEDADKKTWIQSMKLRMKQTTRMLIPHLPLPFSFIIISSLDCIISCCLVCSLTIVNTVSSIWLLTWMLVWIAFEALSHSHSLLVQMLLLSFHFLHWYCSFHRVSVNSLPFPVLDCLCLDSRREEVVMMTCYQMKCPN